MTYNVFSGTLNPTQCTNGAMTSRQCIPARLDQYVNQDPRLLFKARPLLAQLRQTPGLYSRPGLYLRPGFYSRKYGTSVCAMSSHYYTVSEALSINHQMKPY